jgi:hypothetical protein
LKDEKEVKRKLEIAKKNASNKKHATRDKY